MSYVNPLVSNPPEEESFALEPRSIQDIMEALFQELTTADKKSLQALENVYVTSEAGRWDSVIHIQLIMDSFTSSLYSDVCKKYFAAAHIDDSAFLIGGDQFLTEEIILSNLSRPGWKFLSGAYIDAIIKSSHLSGRVIEALFQDMSYSESQWVLETLPSSVVTSGVIKTLISKVIGGPYNLQFSENRRFAANQIRRAHPEYQGFPDDWALKVFCGE